MGLSSRDTRTPSPVLLEMPRTPKKRPGGGIRHAQHSPPSSNGAVAVVATNTVNNNSSNSSSNAGSITPTKLKKEAGPPTTPTVTGCDGNNRSPRRQQQQQPYVQHNIDRYFTPQLATASATAPPVPSQQAQSCQSVDLSAPVVVADAKGINNGSGPGGNDSLNECSSNASVNHNKPQKENVPDATPMPPTKKGQQRGGGGNRQTVTGRRGTAGRSTAAAAGDTTKARRTRTQRRQTPAQKSQQKLTTSDGKGVVKSNSADEDKDVKRITDYFQLRRSHRKTKGEMIKCRQMIMEEKVLHADESGFQIVKFEDKGRGVVSNVDLKAGDYVLEYAGDLIDLKEARRREEL